MCFCCRADFNDLFKNRFEECKTAIRAVNNRLASQKVTNLLAYEPIYHHVVSHKADELDRIRFPALCIEGQAPRCDNFDSKDFNAELNENAILARDPGWEEGIMSRPNPFIHVGPPLSWFHRDRPVRFTH